MTTAAPAPALHLTQRLVAYEDALRLLRIRDTYDWHQKIWKSLEGSIPNNPNKGRFPKGTRTEHQPKVLPDFLCRVDKVEGSFRVLVLSAMPPRKPDWCPPASFSTKLIPDEFFAHSRYRFSLLANPTKKVRSNHTGERTKNGRRLALTQRDELVAWLERKAATGGFTVHRDSLRTIPRGREFFHKDGTAHGAHTAVDFQGELTVTNPAQFRATVATGLGSAKAFGFGLLALAPLSLNPQPSTIS